MCKKIIGILVVALFVSVVSLAQTPWIGRTYCKITLDTKLMENPDCSLGGGGGLAATWDRVYAHLGLCTCDVDSDVRDCTNDSQNEAFCFSQITPYQSQVWQHVVGNWGDIAEDDGVGLMTTLGDGVYSIEFIVEDYFSSADVSTEETTTSALPSVVWQVNEGGRPYTMGMVFRNIDGTSSGRDLLCKDLFLVDILGSPTVIQGSDPEGPVFPAIIVDVHDASVEEIMTLSDNTVVYPNPAADLFFIKYKIVKNNTDVNIRVFDIQGKLVIEKNMGEQNFGWYDVTFDTQDLLDGVYMIQISLDNYISHTERILIAR